LKVVYFQRKEEMKFFCDILKRAQKKLRIEICRHIHWGREIWIDDERVSLEEVVRALVAVFMSFRYKQFIERIIRNIYYYEDPLEIERIMTLAHHVLRDPYYKKRLWKNASSLWEYVYSLLRHHVQVNHPIHFDSLITFC